MSFSKLIKERRIELGLSQKAVGEAVGVDVATVSRWESGKRTPSEVSMWENISENMGLPLILIREEILNELFPMP